MRNKIIQIPNRVNLIKTGGSNTFISTFRRKEYDVGIVEKTRKYNWLNYKLAVLFTLIIGTLTYFSLEFLFF
ncbi:MAG: hypothetical protein P1U56_14390 [Saprospiraceae bacterium]|nr:hypothetical protein [Saprospiraceae bacterium]